MNPTTPARRQRLWLAPLLLCIAQLSAAADIGSLYEVNVPLRGSGDAAQSRAFAEGMAAVLVRVTGRRDAPAAPGLAQLVDQAPRYVRSFRRAPGGLLAISFDGGAIEQAVAAAGLPFWAADRPATLVWLVLERDGVQELATAAARGPERRAIELAASQRGLPLTWPVGDAMDDPRLRIDQTANGDVAALREAAGRYGVEGILVGRPSGDSTRWTFAGAGETREVQGTLEDGVHLAADRYAAALAVAGGAQRNEVTIEVTGIHSAAAYAEASRQLEGLEAVRGVVVREVRPDTVVYVLTVRGGDAGLRRALAAGGRFVPAGSAPSGPVFRWQP
jgi:uncharacterized protein